MKPIKFDNTFFPSKFVFFLFIILSFNSLIFAQNPTPTPLNPNLPSLFAVGDSTANNNANGGLGWGDPFKTYFDSSKVNVVNRARGGRSSRTYFTEGLWEKTLNEVKQGDVVLLQFGHNDGGGNKQKKNPLKKFYSEKGQAIGK